MLSLLFITLASLLSATPTTSPTPPDPDKSFERCFSARFDNRSSLFPISRVLVSANSTFYPYLLTGSVRNLRFLNSSSSGLLKPEFLVNPCLESHVQAAVICARESGLHVRTRSGGHDYEGLSTYASTQEFVLVDLSNFRSIEIDLVDETAWVEAGATLGELYYEIAKKSGVHGFPGGSCPTVGVGGQISGGGFGTMLRKYGLAADSVVDARIVGVNGAILDRNSMGEDLFWAIRGGGGASFGVILSWKVRLVPVPETVTIFMVTTTLDRNGDRIFGKWENVSHNLDQDIFLHSIIKPVNRTIQFSFVGLFLGRTDRLLTLMTESFPELNLTADSCQEVTWIQSVMYFADFEVNQPTDLLLNRTGRFKGFFKAKSDYVNKPIPQSGLKGLYRRILEQGSSSILLILTPYGGRMSEISDSETPFPHRKGYMYKIQYIVTWDKEEETEEKMGWMRKLYGYMTRYVSEDPRAAYYNYRDLDLGRNEKSKDGGYQRGRIWGIKYFKGNFDRLVRVKTVVDPDDFFWNEQSIPVSSSPLNE